MVPLFSSATDGSTSCRGYLVCHEASPSLSLATSSSDVGLPFGVSLCFSSLCLAFYAFFKKNAFIDVLSTKLMCCGWSIGVNWTWLHLKRDSPWLPPTEATPAAPLPTVWLCIHKTQMRKCYQKTTENIWLQSRAGKFHNVLIAWEIQFLSKFSLSLLYT